MTYTAIVFMYSILMMVYVCGMGSVEYIKRNVTIYIFKAEFRNVSKIETLSHGHDVGM